MQLEDLQTWIKENFIFFYKASKGKIPLVADKNRDLKRTRPQKIELKWTQNQLQVEYLKDLRAWIKGKISFFFHKEAAGGK